MILLPIGHEGRPIRRPWLTLGLIALNVVGLLAVWLDNGASDVLLRRGQLRSFLADHPDLELPRDLASWFDENERAASAKARSSAVKGTGSQETLDVLSQRMRAAVDRLPHHRFGFVPARPRTVALLTHMFLHAGFWHLLGNMIFLWFTAPFLEELLGKPAFATLYLVSGFAAAGCHLLRFPDTTVPLVGASGAIAGVMGAFLVRLSTSRIRFLLVPTPVTVWLPAFVVFPLWLLEQLAYARYASGSAGVAFWAHIGGFASGAVAAIAIRMAGLEETLLRRAVRQDVVAGVQPILARAAQARERGDLGRARNELARAIEVAPDQPDVWQEAFAIALEAGDLEEASKAGGRLLDRLAARKERERAVEFADRIATADVPAALYLSAGRCLERVGDTAMAVESYDRAVAQEPGAPAALRALLRMAEISRESGDLAGARRLYERGRSHPACVPPWPDTIARALADIETRRGSNS